MVCKSKWREPIGPHRSLSSNLYVGAGNSRVDQAWDDIVV